MPLLLAILSIKPSQALLNLVTEPAKLFSIVSAILSAAPSAFSNSSFKTFTSSAPLIKVVKAAALLLSVRANASVRSIFLVARTSKALVRSLLFLTEKPILLASLLFSFDSSASRFFSPVPAIEPRKPLSANLPSKAVTVSISMLADLAIGATNFIASLKSVILRADLEKLRAITSTTL